MGGDLLPAAGLAACCRAGRPYDEGGGPVLGGDLLPASWLAVLMMNGAARCWGGDLLPAAWLAACCLAAWPLIRPDPVHFVQLAQIHPGVVCSLFTNFTPGC